MTLLKNNTSIFNKNLTAIRLYRIFPIADSLVGVNTGISNRPVQKSILKEWMEELSKNCFVEIRSNAETGDKKQCRNYGL